MKKFNFNITPEERDALERIRVAMAARSHGEVLRRLIARADASVVSSGPAFVMEHAK